jgi:hypothetical protein
MGSAGVGSAPWVHSGWGIDALLGAQTRPNVVLLDSAGRETDLHPACFAANGDGIYRMKTGEDWPFPAAGFAGQGRLLDRAVRCLTPEVEVLCHTDDEFGAYGFDVRVA